MSTKKPYIGVTGVMSGEQTDALLSAIPEVTPHLVMIGVLVSSRTLAGSQGSRRYPPPADFSGIFRDHPHALNLLHFNTEASDRGEILDDLECAQSIAGRHCHGFQLNMRWPDPALIELYKASTAPSKTVVLQCGKAALLEVENSGAGLAKRLKEYLGLIDYVLIDPSGGEGKQFAPDLAIDCFSHVKELGFGYGIAGGNEEANVDRLRPILERHSPFSTDAESRLRDEADRLNLSAALGYLRATSKLFGEYIGADIG